MNKRFEAWQFALDWDDVWGWIVQIFPNHLEIGRTSQVPNGIRYWYIEWRLRGEWKAWDQFKGP